MKMRGLYQLSILLLILLSASAFAVLCGNGITEGIEECDEGTDNSDTQPDKCRTDCSLPSCGDGVEDYGEECDEGSMNSDEIPAACRTDCKEAYCGDGVIDDYYGEECDVGDADANNGCYQCQRCYYPEDNLHITESGRFCSDFSGTTYTLADSGEEGVIIIENSPYENIIFDCNGVKLRGTGAATTQNTGYTQPSSQMAQLNNQQQSNTQSDTQSGGFFSNVVTMVSGWFGGGQSNSNSNPTPEPTPTNPPPSNTGGNSVEIKYGTAFYIKGENVILANCDVSDYKNAVKIDPTDCILVNNKLCGNNMDIRSANQNNFGTKNKCDSAVNWNENGVNGCTYSCDGNINTQSECPVCESQCPECEECAVCEECPSCEEQEFTEPTKEEQEAKEETNVQEEPEQTPEETPNETPEEDPVEKCEVLDARIGTCKQRTCPSDKAKKCRFFGVGQHPTIRNKEPMCDCVDTKTEEQEECIDEYTEKGYSEEKAEDICLNGEDTDEKTDETSEEMRECIERQMSEFGNRRVTEEEAIGICSRLLS